MFRLLAVTAILLPAAALSQDGMEMMEGRYLETTTVIAATFNGNDLNPADLGAPTTEARCFNAEVAASPAIYFLEEDDDDACTGESGTVANGQIDVSAQCRMDNGATMAIDAKGNYFYNGWSVMAEAKSDMGLNLTMQVVGRHDGACRGDET